MSARQTDGTGTRTAFALLASKLRPPRVRVALVERAKLVRALCDTQASVVVVSAPAGYGKTVTLEQWSAADSRPVGWLQLDGGDNDPVVFFTYMAAALDRVAGLDADVFRALARPRPRLRERVLPLLGAGLAGASPFALVLDDCHLVSATECWALVGLLIGLMPEGSTLMLSSRTDPDLPLARLRAQGRLLELRLDRLAFDEHETSRLVGLHRAEYTEELVDALLESTEGWAAGLSLALLACTDPTCEGVLAHVRGDQHAIAAYLVEEVLARQPEDLQVFLEQTSILDALCAPLCAAVTGRKDAVDVLARLARANLFVSTLDDHDEWFRYHHLFADLLRARLERGRTDELPRLHRAAATWYEAQGDPYHAVRHYLAAGDVEATVWFAARAVDDYLVTARVSSAKRLMGLYTEDQLLAHAPLAIAAGWVYVMAAGSLEEQRRWASIMRDYRFADGPSPDGAATLSSSHGILMAELGLDGLTQMLREFERAAEIETQGDEWEEMACHGIARTHYLLGSPARARAIDLDWLTRAHDPETVAAIQVDLALMAADDDCWDEAEERMAIVVRMTPGLGLDVKPHFSMYLLGLLLRARLLARRGDTGTMSFVRSVESFMRDMVHQAPWARLLGCATLGEVALERGEIGEAQRLHAQAQSILTGYPDAGMPGARTVRLGRAIEARLLAEPISRAEHRVLELLPTCLTEQQIAERLFVSRATVKTHVGAIYRKLEVSNRGQAVARARELGLLPG